MLDIDPHHLDIVDWATTSMAFRRIIERDSVVIKVGEVTE
uniref:Uncharacterized protein n=1 Tax=Candidatus Kentrum sp. FW TaxID=2126338 RepID=A0A450U2J9_9GAMM|nr:MAG: hypothetical protein BECKFW1821C_GA0114237_11198 [Candidatus Kentron sp. FW]